MQKSSTEKIKLVQRRKPTTKRKLNTKRKHVIKRKSDIVRNVATKRTAVSKKRRKKTSNINKGRVTKSINKMASGYSW